MARCLLDCRERSRKKWIRIASRSSSTISASSTRSACLGIGTSRSTSIAICSFTWIGDCPAIRTECSSLPSTAEHRILKQEVYYSIGGGFIMKEGEGLLASEHVLPVPHPFANGAELLEQADSKGLPIWRLMLENESALRPEQEVRIRIAHIWSVMNASIERGLMTSGILPGGLKVRRRAPGLFQRLQSQTSNDPLRAMDWVNVFAMAVNEENAAGGRVVTAPTNGAAGLVPAVARYYRQFVPKASEEGLARLFLTAGAIGILYKENASISGAEVGCQGEVGVACSMAAAGLAGALGATNPAVEHAAEIGMEHHLGMTCDPIGGPGADSLYRAERDWGREGDQRLPDGYAGIGRTCGFARPGHSHDVSNRVGYAIALQGNRTGRVGC